MLRNKAINRIYDKNCWEIFAYFPFLFVCFYVDKRFKDLMIRSNQWYSIDVYSILNLKNEMNDKI